MSLKQFMAKVDWTKMLGKVNKERQPMLAELKKRYDELGIALETQNVGPIPFERLRASIPPSSPVQAQLGELESRWTTQPPPTPPTDNPQLKKALQTLQNEYQAEMAASREFLQSLEADIQVVKSYLERLEKLPKYEDITVDQYFELFPEVQQKIYKEIEEENWGTEKPK